VMGNENKKVNPSLYVYLLGIILLGATYELVKSALGGEVLFVCAVVIYLLALRLIGDFISRKWHERKST
jgi:tellurite resistance protein TehA-like permease